jgi:hypothetical protein
VFLRTLLPPSSQIGDSVQLEVMLDNFQALGIYANINYGQK